MIPTVDEIEEYLQFLEELLFSSLSTPELPDIREAVNRLWLDISRYGPGLPSFPEVNLPGPGDFELPPPPTPPVNRSWLHRASDFSVRHPWKTGLAVAGFVGLGLYLSLRRVHHRTLRVNKTRHSVGERRQVVVVLGADTPLGLPLVTELERRGYIVIASVSTPPAAEIVEHDSHGYIRALILDPNEPNSVPVFLRSLTSTLSRRFPITLAGDPYTHPASHPYIHTVISLLCLASPPIYAPLEHLSLNRDYLPYLISSHITPMQVIQGLLPLLRTGPARTKDIGSKSIIVCLPATAARVGLPFSSLQAMSSAATLRGIEVLRREINIAALTDKTESMKNIKVVVIDVGSLDDSGSASAKLPPHDLYKAMEGWSASEKVTYGPAFASIFHQVPAPSHTDWRSVFKDGYSFGIARRGPTMAVFVDTLVRVVRGDTWTIFGVGLGLSRVRNWIFGRRISVGAGAHTYRIASYLPSTILDTLLSIPHFLISIRNSLLPAPPFIVHQEPPTGRASSVPAPHNSTKPANRSENDHEDGDDSSPPGSEAETDSNSGEDPMASWVRLKTQGSQGQASA